MLVHGIGYVGIKFGIRAGGCGRLGVQGDLAAGLDAFLNQEPQTGIPAFSGFAGGHFKEPDTRSLLKSAEDPPPWFLS